MSTSYDIDAVKPEKFVFEVNAPKELQAVLMDTLGKKEEKEVLINRNTIWEVKDIKTDTNKKTKENFYRIKLMFVKK